MAKKPKKKNNPLKLLLRGLSREKGQLKPVTVKTNGGRKVRPAPRPAPRPVTIAKPTVVSKPKPIVATAKPMVTSAPASAAMLKSINTMRMPKVALAPKLLKGNIKLHNAVLSRAISSIALTQLKITPRKKSDIDGPVSGAPEPTGSTIFENGKDTNRKYVLPEYEVAEDVLSDASGTTRKAAVATTIAPDGRFMLEVGLDPHKSDGHKRRAADAEFLDHKVRCSIEFPDPRLANRTTKVTAEELLEGTDGRIIARIYFDSSTEFGQAMKAILDTESASLIIDRVAQVWLPVKKNASAPKPARPPQQPRRPRVRRRPRRVRPQTMEMRALPVGGIRLARPQIAAIAAASAAAQASQEYRKTSRTISQKLNFWLLRDLHADLLDAVGGEVPAGGSFRIERVEFEERVHSYFIDPNDRDRVHFLPDSFRLQRKNDVPRTPLMLVRSVPATEEGGETQFELEFIATPHIDEDRLLAASDELGFTDTDGERHEFEFVPLSVSGAELRLALPSSSGGGFEVIANAQVDLQSGVSVRLQLAETDFLSIFNALRGEGSHIVMNGEVKLDLGGPAPETIPVELRLDSMNGEALELDLLQPLNARSVNISLLNVIESPLRIEGLRPVAVVGEDTIPLNITKKQPDFGQVIQPGSDFRMRVEAAADLPEDGSFHVLYEDMDIEIDTDHEAVFDAVFDESSSVALEQEIEVATFAPFFTNSGDHENGALIAFFIEFQDGDDVTLEATQLKSETSIELPLADIVFRKESEGEYTYRISEIRERGMVGPTAWKTSTSSTLNVLPIQPGDLA